MADDEIKQIKPDTSDNPSSVDDMSKADSPKESKTLIPKIETSEKVAEPQQSSKVSNKLPKKPRTPEQEEKIKKLKKAGLIAGIVFLVLFVLIGIPSIFIFSRAKAFYNQGMTLGEAVKQQDLVKVKEELEKTKEAQRKLKSSYKFIGWTKLIPFFGSYVKDGQRVIDASGYGLEAADVLINVSEPYADILGFKGTAVLGEATSAEETTEERIDFIVKTLPDLAPRMQEVSEKIALARAEIEKINPNRYPAKLAGYQVREKVKSGVILAQTVDDFVRNGVPLLKEAPYLLGIDEKRTYLVLFQNDKELRPTGGFMTAYSIMNVENATFEPGISSDIYSIDAQYTPTIEAPDPIVDYLKGPYIADQDIRLRDMNWSPDFKESMKLFTKEAEDVGIDEIDGVIAVDTKLLENILDVIGPIGVPGFGNFSTEIVPECDCPQVIYELESFADVEGPIVWDPVSGEIVYRPPNSDNRKKIIGPLMNSIMANALAQPKEKVPDLFEAGFKSLIEKHVLLYLFEDSAQAAVESFGIAGRIKDYEGDYLHINDANLGGRKSNLYVTQEVDQDISVAKDGTIEKTVTITYNNPTAHDGWLNSVLPNWVRIYVPKGSELIDFSGVEDRKDPYEEFGKTVFAGYFELRPQGIAKVTVTYKLPFKADGDYSIFMQKQPGKDKPLYIIRYGKKQEEFYLRQDEEKHFII
jgi:hypothetical protein